MTTNKQSFSPSLNWVFIVLATLCWGLDFASTFGRYVRSLFIFYGPPFNPFYSLPSWFLSSFASHIDEFFWNSINIAFLCIAVSLINNKSIMKTVLYTIFLTFVINSCVYAFAEFAKHFFVEEYYIQSYGLAPINQIFYITMLHSSFHLFGLIEVPVYFFVILNTVLGYFHYEDPTAMIVASLLGLILKKLKYPLTELQKKQEDEEYKLVNYSKEMQGDEREIQVDQPAQKIYQKRDSLENIRIPFLQLLVFLSAYLISYILRPYHPSLMANDLKIRPPYKHFQNGLLEYYQSQGLSNIAYFSTDKTLKIINHSKIPSQKIFSYDFVPSDSFQWIHFENPDSLCEHSSLGTIVSVQKTLEKASHCKKGISLVWQNRDKFMQLIKGKKQQNLLNNLGENGFYYKQAISLNMRGVQKKFILIFTKEKPIVRHRQFVPRQPSKNYLGLQFVSRMRQNLRYLRQWMGYHMHLGVDKFFLFDNSGSGGSIVIKSLHTTQFSNSTHNKYNISLDCYGFTQQEQIQVFDQLWEDYKENLIYVPWQPVTQDGQIFYAQTQAVEFYRYYFGDVTQFTFFPDVDQYAFSPNNYNLDQYVREKHKSGITNIRLFQTKFGNRVCYDNTLMIDIAEYVPMKNIWKSDKLIVKNSQIAPGQNIHNINSKRGREYEDFDQQDMRFNHFHLFQAKIEWAIAHGLAKDSKIYFDTSMQRYREPMEKICKNGNCADHFSFKCSRANLNCPNGNIN